MPVSTDELVTELRACFRAGATGVHLHVRDRSGAETLEPLIVNATCQQVREAAGELDVHAEIGLTTGAWMVPDLAERIAMIREWEGVDYATVNISEEGFEDVMTATLDVGIGSAGPRCLLPATRSRGNSPKNFSRSWAVLTQVAPTSTRSSWPPRRPRRRTRGVGCGF